MTLELFAAGAMLLGLVIYALTGGADFGGGILDLAARGPRRDSQRAAIERALAPVWEANHVWLIFVVTVLFTAFPRAFARIGIELHVPVTVLLIAIVFRGSAFVFRQYGAPTARARWGHVFAWSSMTASLFLGVVLGGLTTGTWLGLFPLVIGVMTAFAFAFLAAAYLCVEVREDALRDEFRRHALAAGIGLAIVAFAAALVTTSSAPRFAAALFAWPRVVVVVVGALAMVLALVCLRRRRYLVARACAIVVVSLVVAGWAFAHYPMLVAPDVTVSNAAAPRVTLSALVPVLVGGSAVLLPSLWWLIRVFKRGR